MAFVHKDQGTISRGEAADLLQGCDVTIHGKGPVGGHQAQSILLWGGRWLVSQAVPTHPLSGPLQALSAELAPLSLA